MSTSGLPSLLITCSAFRIDVDMEKLLADSLKIRDRHSQSPFQILLEDQHGIISTGSAFLFEEGNGTFLITNWHNVSGKDFFEKHRYLTGTRGPTHFSAKLITKIGPPDLGLMASISHRVELYDEAMSPLWLEHPSDNCDVIALPFVSPSNIGDHMHVPVNRISTVPIPVRPGSVVYIIGFRTD
jgi:hypothetical protein